jgi:hypothetical protein
MRLEFDLPRTVPDLEVRIHSMPGDRLSIERYSILPLGGP